MLWRELGVAYRCNDRFFEFIRINRIIASVPYSKAVYSRHTYINKKRETLLSFSFSTQSRGRTGTGVNLLVFETSASTDSAIWASDLSELRCKYTTYFRNCKFLQVFFAIFSGCGIRGGYSPRQSL